jgi:Ca2+-binding RTX toxin-like protein
VVENANKALTRVPSAISYTTAVTSEPAPDRAAAINGTGNALDNLILGNSASNTLIGGAGNDTMRVKRAMTPYDVTETGVVTENANEGVVLSAISYPRR